MPLKIRDIHEMLEQKAPLKYMESYDNAGLMVGDMDSVVYSVLVALDCTLKVIDEAEEKGCNLIFCHHPLIFNKPSSITTGDLLGSKIINLISKGINVYSSHTNLDSAKGGFNDMAAEILGFKETKVIDEALDGSSSGIGRIIMLSEPLKLKDFIDLVKRSFNISMLRYSGDDNLLISKAAVINGSGQSYFKEAVAQGCQCILTGDTTYHNVSDLMEQGIAVVDAGHYETEWPAISMFSKWLENQIIEAGFNDVPVFLSESNVCPYKYK